MKLKNALKRLEPFGKVKHSKDGTRYWIHYHGHLLMFSTSSGHVGYVETRPASPNSRPSFLDFDNNDDWAGLKDAMDHIAANKDAVPRVLQKKQQLKATLVTVRTFDIAEEMARIQSTPAVKKH